MTASNAVTPCANGELSTKPWMGPSWPREPTILEPAVSYQRLLKRCSAKLTPQLPSALLTMSGATAGILLRLTQLIAEGGHTVHFKDLPGMTVFNIFRTLCASIRTVNVRQAMLAQH